MSTFTYGAKPKVVTATNDRFGNRRQKSSVSNDTIPVANNIMHDNRVLRGSTYNLQYRKAMNAPMQAGATGPYRPQVTNHNLHHQSISKTSKPTSSHGMSRVTGGIARSVTPPPVEGRVHTSVQTDTYLHDLRIKTVKVDSETQTLNELDVPAPRLFKPFEPIFFPRNCYKDASINTDIEELYDFDLHVEPVLDILVESALTNAMFEVLEEQELKNITSRDTAYAHNIQFHEANVDKLEQHATRLDHEREVASENRAVAIRQDQETANIQKLRTLTKQSIQSVGEYTYNRLLDSGYFYDPLQRQVVFDFLPTLVDTVNQHVQKHNYADNELNNMIASIFEHALVQHAESYKQLNSYVQEKSYSDAEKIVSYLESHQEANMKRLNERNNANHEEEEPEEELEEEIDETSVIEIHESDDEDIVEEKQALLLARESLAEKRRIKAENVEKARVEKETRDREEQAYKQQLHIDRVDKQAKVLGKGYLLVDSHRYVESQHLLEAPEHQHMLGEQDQYKVFEEKNEHDTLSWIRTQRVKGSVSSLIMNIGGGSSSSSSIISNYNSNSQLVEDQPIEENLTPETTDETTPAIIDDDTHTINTDDASLIDPSILDDMKDVEGRVDENILNQALMEHEYGLDGE